MSMLFLSHSSQNNPEAVALRDWLLEQGWDNLFLDLDPERGIAAGERWANALHQAADRCDAVLFLVGQAWLDSAWCRREFQLAQRLNKRIFVLLIEDLSIESLPDELTEHWQLVNLARGQGVLREVRLPGTESSAHVVFSQDGLARLKAGLNKAGLDPRHFPWPPADDPKRAPYRGLLPLETEDAGIFFGREALIIDILARLRGLREGVPPRFLVILGASGAGKSSFLRAGILPRLARDERFFCPLPVLRPEQAVLDGPSGLISCLTQACRQHGVKITRHDIATHIATGVQALRPVLQALRTQATPLALDDSPPSQPLLVLCIDQGEELFQVEGQAQAHAFMQLIHDLLRQDDPPLLVLWTIRSDSYETLQSAPTFAGIRQHTFSLPPMPTGAYQQVIEGPARLLAETERRLHIEPALTQALLHDLERNTSRDALPLLAFTLERLYYQYGDDGTLRLEEYQRMGGIRGAIEGAVDNALGDALANPRLPNDRDECLKLLRRGLIPWLAGIDPDTGQPRRRVAYLHQVPAEAQAIIEHFVAHRLLATDTDAEGQVTLEPAHEALLRQWSILNGWLEDDAAALSALEAVQSAARDWSANLEDTHWLLHQKGRLEDAEQLLLRRDLADFLTTTDRAYLTACRQLENATREQELRQAQALAAAQKRVAKRTRLGLVATMILLVVAVAIAFIAQQQREQAETQRVVAEEASLRADEQRVLAEEQRQEAEQQREQAETQRVLAEAASLQAYEQRQEAEQQLIHANHNFGLALHERARQVAQEKNYIAAQFYLANSYPKLIDSDALTRSRSLWSEVRQANPYQAVWRSPVSSHHDDGIHAVSFSPNGQILASASWKTIRLWDVKNGEILVTLTGHEDDISSLSFSPDGRTLASISVDRTTRLWDIESGEVLASWAEHQSDFDPRDIMSDLHRNSVIFSSDGLMLASSSDDNNIRLWNVDNAKLLTTLTGHTRSVYSLIFTNDGRTLASASADRTIRLWDVQNGEVLAILTGHTAPIYSLSFAPDGRTLASASADRTIRLWDIESGEHLTTLTGHSGSIFSVIFSSHSHTLASASSDKTIRLWDVKSGENWATLTGHAASVYSLSFTPDGRTLASGSLDHTIRLWDVAGGEAITTWNGHTGRVTSVSYAPDGRTLASSSQDNTIRLWDVASGEMLATLTGHTSGVNSLSYAPDGRTLASSSQDNTIRLWDVASGETLATLTGHTSWVTSVSFAPDGRTLASASFDRTLRLWDVASGETLATLTEHTDWVTSVSFAPDGRTLASGSSDNTIRLWEVASGEMLATLTGHTRGVTSVSFAPDGRTLASGSSDNTIRLWEVTSGEMLATLTGHTSSVESVSFAPDGRSLASAASGDGAIHLWDIVGNVFLNTSIGHAGKINEVIFSPDGRTLASSSYKTIRLWDVASGQTKAALTGHTGSVTSVSFSPDGRILASASGIPDYTIRLWDVVSGQHFATLTGHERVSYILSFSPDSGTLAFTTAGAIYLWDIDSSVNFATSDEHWSPVYTTEHEHARLVGGHLRPIYIMEYAPDGRILASAAFDGTIRLWDVVSGEGLVTLFTGHGVALFSSLVFSTDGRTLAAISEDRTIRLWDVESGQELATLTRRESSVNSLIFAPNRRTFNGYIYVSLFLKPTLWNIENGETIATFGERAKSANLTPDGHILASVSEDGTIRLWDLQALSVLENPQQRQQWVEKQQQLVGYQLDGLDLVIVPPEPNLYGQPSFEPQWTPNHPFHWLSRAEQGDAEAMLQLGIIYHRSREYDTSRDWYQKAEAAGHPDAAERLNVLQRTREISQSLMERTDSQESTP